jgi:hypothetical protein
MTFLCGWESALGSHCLLNWEIVAETEGALSLHCGSVEEGCSQPHDISCSNANRSTALRISKKNTFCLLTKGTFWVIILLD